MACPNQGIVNEIMTFTIRTLDSGDEPVWADAVPTYSIYEESTLSGDVVPGFSNQSMTEDDDTIGLYFENVLIDGGLFDLYKTYIIVIDAIISGQAVSRTYAFVVVGTHDVIGEGLIDNVNAVADYAGSFKQGGVAILKLRITTFDGTPIDPYQITTTISGPTQAGDQDPSQAGAQYPNVETGIPFQADRGYYIYTWNIPPNTTTGTYVVDWEYFVDEIERHEYQNLMVTAAVAAPYFYTERWVAFRTALDIHLSCAQSIPVYYEQARPSYDLRSYHFSFPEWNQSPGARVYRNGELVSSGLEVDYFNGKINFSTALMPQETVNVDYNFRWFSEEELNRFILNALQSMNTYPPHSGYTVENIPDRFTPAVLYGAAKDALRQLMLCVNFQQPAQVFGGPEQAAKAFANFDTLKQNYEKDAEKLLEQKKLGPYPKSRMVVTPEFTLPGGRSRWFRYLFK
jgi:hypothetical protein